MISRWGDFPGFSKRSLNTIPYTDVSTAKKAYDRQESLAMWPHGRDQSNAATNPGWIWSQMLEEVRDGSALRSSATVQLSWHLCLSLVIMALAF